MLIGIIHKWKWTTQFWNNQDLTLQYIAWILKYKILYVLPNGFCIILCQTWYLYFDCQKIYLIFCSICLLRYVRCRYIIKKVLNLLWASGKINYHRDVTFQEVSRTIKQLIITLLYFAKKYRSFVRNINDVNIGKFSFISLLLFL